MMVREEIYFKWKMAKYPSGVDKHLRNYNRFRERNKLEDSPLSQVKYFAATLTGSEREYIGFGNAEKLVKIAQEGTPEEIAEMLQKRWFKSGSPDPQKTLDYMNFLRMRTQEAQPAEPQPSE